MSVALLMQEKLMQEKLMQKNLLLPRRVVPKFMLTALACLLVTACANAPLQSSSTSQVYRPGQSPSSVPEQGPAAQTPTTMTHPQTAPAAPVYVRPPETNNAAAALLRDANAALSNNDLSRAVSNAERAQRVAPRDPSVYLTLSRIRCAQASYGQCEQLARKALSLQPSLDQRDEAQRLIAKAKTAE